MIKFEQKRILGSYFRNVRKSRKLTIRQISASLRGISETCISEFETGRNDTSEDVVAYLFDSLSIDFNFDVSFLTERIITVDRLFELYGTMNFDEFDRTMEQISSIKYENTYCYPLHLICKFYYNNFILKQDENRVNQIINDINIVKPLFSTKEQQLVSILMYRHVYPKNEKKALKLLRDEYKKAEMSMDVPSAVMAYLLSGSENLVHKYHVQIQLLEKALSVFIGNGYILRTIYCLNDLGLAYIECFDYQKGVESLEKALVLAKQINDQDRIAGIMNNLAMVYYQKKEYHTAKEYALKAIEREHVAGSSYSIIVAAEYYLENHNAAKSWLNKFEAYLQSNPDSYFEFLLRIRKAMIYEKTGAHYYSLLKKYLDFVRKEMPVSAQIEAYRYLIDYCERNKQVNDLINYQKQLINCYEKIKN